MRVRVRERSRQLAARDKAGQVRPSEAHDRRSVRVSEVQVDAGQGRGARADSVAVVSDLHKQIVAETRAWVTENWAGPPRALCLFHAIGVVSIAAHHGIRLLPQAGSAFWRRVPEELDDGEVPTHFGYQWCGMEDLGTIARLATDQMPEMHVWAGDPERQHIVDLTTRYVPAQCKETAGMEWLSPPLPDFAWGDALGAYTPDLAATKLAIELYGKELRGMKGS